MKGYKPVVTNPQHTKVEIFKGGEVKNKKPLILFQKNSLDCSTV
jgi:hypothetical protein